MHNFLIFLVVVELIGFGLVAGVAYCLVRHYRKKWQREFDHLEKLYQEGRVH